MSHPDNGPFQSLYELQGWHALDMSELECLLHFARNNIEINSVAAICYNSLLSGDIQITRESDAGTVQAAASTSKKDTLQYPSAQEAIATRKRSDLFGGWAWNVAFLEDAIGFAPVTSVPNTDLSTAVDDPYIPTVLNLSRLKVSV